MSDSVFILYNCTSAMAGSEDAIHLLEQKSRLEQAVSSGDPALTLDTAKSLLESIFKTILTDRLPNPKLTKDFSPLYVDVRNVLKLNSNTTANEILGKLTSSIVHNIGELRNKYGAASHGDDGYFENPIEMPDAEMIAHIVDGMGGFLFKKHKKMSDPVNASRIFYGDYEDFNDWLDTQYDAIKIPIEQSRDILFSHFLFAFDIDGYRAMLLQYRQTEIEDVDPDESIVQALRFYKRDSQIQSEAQEYEQISFLECESLLEDGRDSWIENTFIINELMAFGEDITKEQASELTEFVQDYALHRTEIDWQNKASAVARFKNLLKRRLIGIEYPVDAIDSVVDFLIDSAKKFYPS